MGILSQPLRGGYNFDTIAKGGYNFNTIHWQHGYTNTDNHFYFY
jgi:hypothetical protein